MSISLADTHFITDLRARMLKNRAEGKPADFGISRDEIKKGLDAIRRNRTEAVANSKSKRTKKEAKPIDLASLFKADDQPGTSDS